MRTDKNLQFITKSLSDAGQVIVYRNFHSGRKQAIGIKTAFDIDENGLLNFPLLTQYEEKITTTDFPVELLFYKKGKPFYVTANGFAVKEKKDNTSRLSIKMETVEFVETANQYSKNAFTNLLRKGINIMASFL